MKYQYLLRLREVFVSGYPSHLLLNIVLPDPPSSWILSPRPVTAVASLSAAPENIFLLAPARLRTLCPFILLSMPVQLILDHLKVSTACSLIYIVCLLLLHTVPQNQTPVTWFSCRPCQRHPLSLLLTSLGTSLIIPCPLSSSKSLTVLKYLHVPSTNADTQCPLCSTECLPLLLSFWVCPPKTDAL